MNHFEFAIHNANMALHAVESMPSSPAYTLAAGHFRAGLEILSGRPGTTDMSSTAVWLRLLPERFSTAHAVDTAATFNIFTERTAKDRLVALLHVGKIEKVGHGRYRKVAE